MLFTSAPKTHIKCFSKSIFRMIVLAIGLFALQESFAQQGTLTDNATFPTTFSDLTIQGSSAAEGSAVSFIKFKLTPNLPPATPGGFVAKATLTFYVGSLNTSGSFNVYRVTSPWGEGDTTAPTYDDANPVITGVPVTAAGSYVTVDLTALTQQWLGTDGLGTGGVPNYGIALVADTNTTAFLFDSKESTTTSHPARLAVLLNHAATADTATDFTGPLAGDVTGAQNATVVSSVGSQSAASIANSTIAANSATENNTPGTIVKRDGSGNFSAGTIVGDITGNAATATNAMNATNADIAKSLNRAGQDADIASPADGQVYYNTSLNVFKVFDGPTSTWKIVDAGAATTLSSSATISGNQVNGELTNATIAGNGVTGNIAASQISGNLTNATIAGYVASAGDTMTGALNLPADGLHVGTNQLVLSAGNIGIGTTSPTAPLSIGGLRNGSAFDLTRANNTDLGTYLWRGSFSDAAVGTYSALYYDSPVFNGTNDPVFFLGYNLDTNNLRKLATEPALMIGMEAHWRNTPTTHMMEQYLQYISISDAQFRPIWWVIDRTTDYISGGINADKFSFQAANGTNQWMVLTPNQIALTGNLGVTGNIGIGTTNPAQKLQVSGGGIALDNGSSNAVMWRNRLNTSWLNGINIDEGDNLNINRNSSSGKIQTFGTTYFFNKAISNINMAVLDNGNVGIGTPGPGEKLEVAGNLKLSGTGNGLIFPNGTIQTTAAVPAVSSILNQTTQQAGANFNISGNGTVGTDLTIGGQIKFPDGTTQATAATGGTIASVTAGTGLSGGGTIGNVTLDVNQGVVAFQSDLASEMSGRQSTDTILQNNINTEASTRTAADTSLQTAVAEKVAKAGDTMTGTLNLPSNGLVVGETQLVLFGSKVGIGTATPQTSLHVNSGNVYVGSPGQGIVLKSPDGSVCKLLTIDNTGAMVLSSITCP